MKKLLILCLACFVMQNMSYAKDYTSQYLKEMKKSQKYSATTNYFEASSEEYKQEKTTGLKDPKLIKFVDYKEVSNADYKAKVANDNIKYKEISKFLLSRKVDDYNVQAYGEDFYKVYRVAEKIIRANNLDFINWRIVIDANTNFNAFMSETNCITLNAGALDTLINNDDALALLIGHEIAHSMLGHSARKQEIIVKLERIQRVFSEDIYRINLKKYLSECRKMEFMADTEGAILAARAGYDLENASELLAYMNTFGNGKDSFSSHPVPEERIKSLSENKKYFVMEDWMKQGRYNIYNSEVLQCQKSSSRNSLVILKGKAQSQNSYYSLETPDQMYMRYAYKSYINGDYEDSIKYFKDYIKENQNNYVAYLYMSYAYECLYNKKKKDKFLELAKEYAQLAKSLAPNDKYVKEQVLAL